MSVQADVLNQTVLAALDSLDEEEGEVIAVGLVLSFVNGDGRECYRAFSDRDSFFEQIGIFQAAITVVEAGASVTAEDDEDE